jgi:MYXO-CTERM domain-containing protein
MSQTLDAAAQVPSLNDPARSRYVVLVTDGWQWCDPYDPSTRFDPVESVAQLKARGITTFVVGFGGSVDALTLNQMAVTAGTALPGCDPAGDEPGLPDPCYFQADDPGELEAALMQIGVVISGETCDGQDNDCDGLVDEDLTRECASACGTGTETCESGQWVGCSAPPPGQEICDGQDNDCDGVADPGCECTVGDTRACGDGTGACAPGTQTCRADGTWSDCEGAVGPMPEMCNGLDDDCDGVVDGDADDEVPGAGDDDVGLAGALCPAGQMCKDGSCGDLGDPVVPPVSEADDASGDASGCGCRAGGRASGRAGAGLVIGLAALALVRRRRRA